MSALVRPIDGYIASGDLARRLVSPPRSMLSPEMTDAGRNDELSFRHVVGRSAGPAQEVAMQWLEQCRELGALRAVEAAAVIHVMERDGVRSIGLLADVLIDAYRTGGIKRHENTLEKTERKMVKYMGSTRLYGNPILLAHRTVPELAGQLGAHTARPADSTFESIDNTTHSMWCVSGPEAVELTAMFPDELYVADGHHRIAAASLLAQEEGRGSAYMPAGLFADDEFAVSSFARGIHDDSIDATELLGQLSSKFSMVEVDQALPRPTRRHTFGMRIAGRSYLLAIPSELIPDDVYEQLDVNLLQTLILAPMFGIDDPRTDKRLDVIADTSDDAHSPDDYDTWFLPFPTSVSEVMDVADLDQTMPPKSTFFLPKLPGGIIARPLDET